MRHDPAPSLLSPNAAARRMKFLSRLRAGLAQLAPGQFAFGVARCPFCGPSMFVRLNLDEAGLRCVRCAASTVHLSVGLALAKVLPDLAAVDACELSADGPFVEHLRRRARSAAFSEYQPEVVPGTQWQGVRCEDVQNLTWADASFDLITHTEVFEHVPDDARGFAELRRVLRPGGRMVFTVPMSDMTHTVERARLNVDGEVEHLLPPQYHVDPFKGNAPVLVFRDYGRDIVQRLQRAGFDEVQIVRPAFALDWAPLRHVISARAAG